MCPLFQLLNSTAVVQKVNVASEGLCPSEILFMKINIELDRSDAYFISCQHSESGENVTEGSFKEPFLRNRKSLSFPTYLTYCRRMITRLSTKGERESN